MTRQGHSASCESCKICLWKRKLSFDEPRGGGDSLIRVGTDVRAQALGMLGVNFCLGIRFWDVNFARTLGYWQFLTKKCVIFDKEVTYLLKFPIYSLKSS